MSKTIIQNVVFKNAAAKDLYDLNMDEKKHFMATAATARISQKVGGRYSVYNGFITGKNLHLVKDKLIVQTWRGQDWEESDLDSTFILSIEQKGKDVVLHVVHANIPDKQIKGIDKGWHTFYWEPWKKFLSGKPILKYPAM